MVLRKPYAFFIRIFKPVHLIMAAAIAYLIYLNSIILNFFNTYMTSTNNVVGESIRSSLINNFLYIIPVGIIILSLIILGIMVRKKKPITFYVVNIFAYIIVIVIYFYTSNFLGVLESSIVAIKVVKLMHDLSLISIFIESVSFVFFVIRGMGLNLKKFNFDSELSKFDINESDKEEFEFDINVDFSEANRKRKKNLRFLKYKYLENKFIVNLSIIVVIALIVFISLFIILKHNKSNTEGNFYSIGNLNISVDNTIILNSNYKGEKITDNYLIIINCNMQSYKQIYLNDFNLKIGEAYFKPTLKYSNYLLDIGNLYDESQSLDVNGNYLIVYEIPEKFTTSDMIFSYSSEGEVLDIEISPKSLISNEISISKNINEEMSFIDSLGDITFKISDYEIKNTFLFKYNYCVKDNDCIVSKEYMKPSLNTNFDKTILRLNVEYSDSSNLKIANFYLFLSKFGSIQYKIDDNWYLQSSNFEELKSNKVSTKNNVYIGIKSEISNAESIKLVFNIRGSKYEYILK